MKVIICAASDSGSEYVNKRLIEDGCLGRTMVTSPYCLQFIRDMFQKLEPELTSEQDF